MAQVTVSSGGFVTIAAAAAGSDALALQNSIAAAINTAVGPNGPVYTATVSGNTAVPPPTGTQNEVLITDSSGGQTYDVSANYQYVLFDASATTDTVNLAPGLDVLSGTVGGHFVGAGGETVALGGGNNEFLSTVSSFVNADYVAAGAGNDTIVDNNGGTLIGGGGSNLIISGSQAGAVDIISSGNHDTVWAMSSVVSASSPFSGLYTGATVQSSGSNALIFGNAVEASSLLVQDTGTNDTVVAGIGPATVSAGGTGLLVGSGLGNMLFQGGAGSATVFGHAGANQTIVGGSGHVLFSDLGGNAAVNGGATQMTVFGGASGDVTFTGASNSGGLVFQALGGNETLNASGSSSGNLIAAGNVLFGSLSGGADSLVGGSGNDTFFGGNANATMTGGAGNNVFAFFKFLGTGTDLITDFNSNDTVFASGYGGSAATLIQNAVTSNGSTSITLSDGTKITFAGMSSSSALTGHLHTF
ncbi:MAG: beta strand repeat-containing protein [Acetobacteraceae bacterium]